MGMMNIGLKRGRESSEFDSITAMANCLMLLSGAAEFDMLTNKANTNSVYGYHDHGPSRVFECKTCNRQFPSFQALGGHRASHKKPKLGGDLILQTHVQTPPPKPKTHECPICGLEFAVGQALGGHMRRHRAAMNGRETDDHLRQSSSSPVSSSVSSPPPHDPPAAKKSNINSITAGSRKVWGLDLNLTPLENDNLEFRLGKLVAS